MKLSTRVNMFAWMFGTCLVLSAGAAWAQGAPEPAQPHGILPSLPAALLALGISFGLALVLGAHRSILCDSALPQMSPAERPFSLGRCQMAFWFVLIFAAWIYCILSAGDYNSITSGTMGLMGISAGTGLAAVAIDRTKDVGFQEAEDKLKALGLVTHQDVGALKKEKKRLAGIAKPTAAQSIQLNSLAAKLVAYSQIIGPYRASSNPLEDLINDVQGPTLHRLQILTWTFGLGAVFLWESFANRKMPEFNQNLLALMAISGGVYAGFKIPERQV